MSRGATQFDDAVAAVSSRRERALRQRARAGRYWWIGLAVFWLLLLAPAALLLRRAEHQVPPEPLGLVTRIEVPESLTPLSRASVRALATVPPRLLVTWRVDTPDADVAYESAEYAYPSGRRLSAPIAAPSTDPLQASASFDFDGDRVADRLECAFEASRHRTTVTSGATGRVLFTYDDPRDYEYTQGAFPLGDLDGDGCAELALDHPRRDRSRYDWPEDCLWSARGWITVVSGRLACER